MEMSDFKCVAERILMLNNLRNSIFWVIPHWNCVIVAVDFFNGAPGLEEIGDALFIPVITTLLQIMR